MWLRSADSQCPCLLLLLHAKLTHTTSLAHRNMWLNVSGGLVSVA